MIGYHWKTEMLQTNTMVVNNTDQTVEHDKAIKSLILCIKWADENKIPLHDVLEHQRVKEIAFVMYQNRTNPIKITKNFTK